MIESLFDEALKGAKENKISKTPEHLKKFRFFRQSFMTLNDAECRQKHSAVPF